MSDIPAALSHEPKGQSLSAIYTKLNNDIERAPFDKAVWDRVLTQAKSEEGTPQAAVGLFGNIPLNELSSMAGRLRDAESLEKQFGLLSESTSTGELWYDLTLGHSNESVLAWASKYPLRNRLWNKGLDLGSGYGNSSRVIKAHVRELVGLDTSILLQTVARKRPELTDTSMPVGDATALPFADASFDLVTSNGLTRYILGQKHNQALVDEIFRVLTPGGSYLEAFPMPVFIEKMNQRDGENGKSVLANLMESFITKQADSADGKPTSYTEQVSMFTKKGFSFQRLSGKDGPVVVIEFRKPGI